MRATRMKTHTSQPTLEEIKLRVGQFVENCERAQNLARQAIARVRSVPTPNETNSIQHGGEREVRL